MQRVALVQRIQVRHQGGNGSVVVQVLEVLRYRLDGSVQGLARLERWRTIRQSTRVPHHQVPHPAEKAANATNAGVAELTGPLVWPQEHEVHAQRVGAKSIEVRVRIDDIAAALAHLGPIL